MWSASYIVGMCALQGKAKCKRFNCDRIYFNNIIWTCSGGGIKNPTAVGVVCPCLFLFNPLQPFWPSNTCKHAQTHDCRLTLSNKSFCRRCCHCQITSPDLSANHFCTVSPIEKTDKIQNPSLLLPGLRQCSCGEFLVILSC